MEIQYLQPRLLCVVIGYLFGCILTAEMVARLFTGKGAAEIGTGNPGMANIMAQVGKKAGFLVLAGDILKTVLGIVAAWLLCGQVMGRETFLWAGLGAALGHNFPAWRGFHGGKGVTVTCVWLILYLPVWGTACCMAGGAVTLLTGYLPLGAVLIPLAAIAPAWYFEGTQAGLFMVLAFAIMVSRHFRGLLRIAQGTEQRKFGR